MLILIFLACVIIGGLIAARLIHALRLWQAGRGARVRQFILAEVRNETQRKRRASIELARERQWRDGVAS